MNLIRRAILAFLVVTSAVAVVFIISTAGQYYLTPVIERPYLPQHTLWKPGGLVGHGLGIVGSMMMLLLLLYSVRKKWRRLQHWGRLSTWLNFHIFLGIMGPLLVIFHTSFKFKGLVSISFWSMVAVALSGFIGRYIYIQIPRRISGEELSLQEIDSQNAEITKVLTQDFALPRETMKEIRSIARTEKIRDRGIAGLFFVFYSDLTGWYRLRRLLRLLAKTGNYPPDKLRELFRLMKAKSKLSRKKAFLEGAHQLFHYWHVVHKPFAYTMLTIMVIHAVVAVTFGYTWLF